MFNLTRKQLIIITILVVVIVLIIAANIFLFLRYSQRQVEVQRQTKIAQDIQTVQLEIDAGRLDQLDVAQLRSQGVAEEAVSIVEQAKRGIDQDKKQVISILDNFDFREPRTADEVTQKLLNLGDVAINKLSELTDATDKMTRRKANIGLFFLAKQSAELKDKIIPILKKSLIDQDIQNRSHGAHLLVQLSEKDAIPVLINAFDYSNIYMISEPPIPLAYYAELTLTDFTDQNLGKNKNAWQSWWEENKNNLQWDEQDKKFKTL